MTRRFSAALAAMLIVAACGKKAPAPEQGGQMAGMQGMSMRSDSMTAMMRAHLDSLAALPPQFAAGMMATHGALASQMLDAMGSDMRMMNMQPDSEWTALADSVKRDLAELPSRSGRALETRLAAHIGRMLRLLDMHRAMMHW